MANRYFHGRELEDAKVRIKQVEAEMERLQMMQNEDQAMYACQGLADEAWSFYELLSEEVQCSWSMLKKALLVKFFSLPKQTDKETRMLIEEFQSLQKLYFVPPCKSDPALQLKKIIPQMKEKRDTAMMLIPLIWRILRLLEVLMWKEVYAQVQVVVTYFDCM